MNLGWMTQKGAGLTATIVALGFVALASYDGRFRYVYLCAAIAAFVYAYRQFRKKDTPFERRERELRRKTL